MIYTTGTLLCLLLPAISASPASPFTSHTPLRQRQAIPDLTGNTGNIPAPIKPNPLPLPLTPSSTPTTTTTTTTTPTPTLLPPTTLSPTPTTTPPADQLNLIRTAPVLSPGTLAGIIAGSTILFLLLLSLATYLIRRTRRPEIAEIPIRRSKLGSRLRHRMFNSPVPPSRSSSRSSTRTLTGGERGGGWLRKGSIGRPVPARWGEGEMLGVPRAAYMRGDMVGVEEERWVGRGMVMVGGRRPVRPVSAEPLGRLSGMGRGMGYLK